MGMWMRRLIPLEDSHPAAAASDEDGLAACAREQLPPGFLQDPRILSNANAKQMLDFRFVRRARRHAAETEQRIARVDERRRAPGLLRLQPRACSRHERRRRHTHAVVGNEKRVGASARREQTRFDGAPVGVGKGGTRAAVDTHDLLLRRVHAAGQNARLGRGAIRGWPNDRTNVDAAAHDIEEAAARVVPPRCTDCRRGDPPSAETLLAALPAPPGTISVES